MLYQTYLGSAIKRKHLVAKVNLDFDRENVLMAWRFSKGSDIQIYYGQ